MLAEMAISNALAASGYRSKKMSRASYKTCIVLCSKRPPPYLRSNHLELIPMAEATISLEPEVNEPPSTLRVLVAEDDPMFRRILQSWLQTWSHEVVVVENGARAWTFCSKNSPLNC